MFNLNLSYAMLVDAGFKRYDYEDGVFYQEHGHHPFVMHLRLSKTVKMEIHYGFDCALLYQAKKRPYKSNFQSYMQLNTMEEVRMTLAVFGHPEKACMLKHKDEVLDTMAIPAKEEYNAERELIKSIGSILRDRKEILIHTSSDLGAEILELAGKEASNV